MGRSSQATKATYACGLDAFARCFDVQSVDLLIAKVESAELDAYNTLDKFVGRLSADGAASKTIWIYVGAETDVLLDKRKLRKLQLPAKVEICIDRIPTNAMRFSLSGERYRLGVRWLRKNLGNCRGSVTF